MLRFGTMGWNYDDWRGPFYASGQPRTSMLGEYARVFPIVELDTTFHATPKPHVSASWAAQTPAAFRFCAKLPQAASHEHRLLGPAALSLTQALIEALREGLGEKLGTLLLQLPPDFGIEEESALLGFVDRLGIGASLAVELRHTSWHGRAIGDALAQREASLVVTDRLDLGQTPTYVRLLGEENAFAHFGRRQRIRSADLARWAQRLSGTDACVFIRNFYEGYAPGTAFALIEALGLDPPTPPGAQQMSLF
jgi:uncharacterized protein YecE (DUF72 family)